MEEQYAVTAEQAAQELLFRRRARQNLIDFTKYTKPDYIADPFHDALGAELDMILRGENDRLMIFAPPQHGKSELSTRRFPALYRALHPTHNIISASYNAEFARGFGKDVRDIVQSAEYARLFPNIKIRSDNRSADEWQIEDGGKYFAVGVGTATTGRGAHLFLIDDPIKDRKEADSMTTREDHWNWYRDVVYTRLQNGGAVVMTLTRWHYDDLAGRAIEIMNQGKGKPWRIVRLPAIADSVDDPLGRQIGEALAPHRFPIEHLREVEQTQGPRSWAAMYQQRPISEEGGMFKPAWFETTTNLHPRRVRVRAWDLAGSLDGDWTVGALMSRDVDGQFVIENIIRFRGTPLDVERRVFSQAAEDGKSTQIFIPQDPGQAGKSQAQHFIRRLAGYQVKSQRPTGSKETRASAFAAQAEARNVKLLPGAWNNAFLEELETFPLGTHDDQVDAVSDAFNALLGPKRPRVLDW